jgi:hypothetical protein
METKGIKMKKFVVLILVFSLLIQVTGCYSSKYISKDEFLNSDKGDIKIVTNDNQSYSLKEGGYFVNNDTIFIDLKSKFKIIPFGVSQISLNDVKEFEKKEYNSTNTVIMVAVSATVISVLAFFFSVLANFKVG